MNKEVRLHQTRCSAAYDLWLDPTNQDVAELKEVVVSYPSSGMQAHQVSTMVNKVGQRRTGADPTGLLTRYSGEEEFHDDRA